MYFCLILFLIFYFWFLLLIFLLSYNFIRIYSFFYLIIFFLISLFLILNYNPLIFWYQSILQFYRISFLNINYILAIDGISIFFLILSSFLLMFCFLIYWFLKYKINLYCFILFFSLWVLFNVFLTLDLFIFYIFFEAIVIPMFLLIGIWGSRTRKIYAAYQFFIYTLFGSVFVLFSFLSIYLNKGSSEYEFILNSYYFESREFLFFLFLFFGFSVKIPIIPVHIWLPEAHVEAPTPGSVILAGILLKLGSYAILRFILPWLNLIALDLIFILLIIALIGFIYTSLIAMNQIDIKKIIAYSSIAHMNYSLIGFFSDSLLGLTGAFIMMFGHALTSGALFLIIGILYDRFKTRLIYYYSGLASLMPIFSIIYFLLILSNFGFPGTINFVGEFLITVGGFFFSTVILILATIGLILTLIYSLFLYNRISFGSLKINFIRYFSDIHRLEYYILIVFVLLIFIFGLYPRLIFNISLLSLLKWNIIFF